MNISQSMTSSHRKPFSTPLAKTRSEFSLEYDRESRKTEHTGFRGPSYPDSFWEASKSLSKDQQINMAALALTSQFIQNGASNENKDFIRSFKGKFSSGEIDLLKGQIKNHLLLEKKPKAEIDQLFKSIDEIWSNSYGKKSVEPRFLPDDSIKFQTPDELFFRTSFKKSDEKKVKALSL